MLVRPAVKRLFCLKARNGLITNTQTIFKFPDKLVGRRAPTTVTPTYVGYTAAELQFTRNTEDYPAAPRRNFEADSAAPWQRALLLDHVQVAAVRAAWHES